MEANRLTALQSKPCICVNGMADWKGQSLMLSEGQRSGTNMQPDPVLPAPMPMCRSTTKMRTHQGPLLSKHRPGREVQASLFHCLQETYRASYVPSLA